MEKHTLRQYLIVQAFPQKDLRTPIRTGTGDFLSTITCRYAAEKQWACRSITRNRKTPKNTPAFPAINIFTGTPRHYYHAG